MTISLRLFIIMLLWTAADSVSAQTITDVLNYQTVGVTGKDYKKWIAHLASGADYDGNSAGGNNSIRLRASNISGIIVNNPGSIVKSITIKLYDTKIKNQQIDIYGKTTPYKERDELYNAKQGELIGSIDVQTKEATIFPDKEYSYIGIRSKSGVIYVKQIEIEWAKSDLAVFSPKIQGNSPFEGSTTISITGDEGSDIYYTLNGEDPSIASTKYTGPFTVSQTTTIKAIAVKDGNISAVSSTRFEKNIGKDTDTNPDIAEKGSLRIPYSVTDVINGQCNNEKEIYVEGYICGAYGDNKVINNKVDANFIIGATADATDCIAIQLPIGNLRDAINVTNDGMIGTKVMLKGNIVASYFGGPGLNSTSEAYIGLSLTDIRYATMYYSKATLQIPDNITAFTYKLDNGELVVSKRISAGENIAAGTAVVLNGEPGDYWCKVIIEDENSVADANNILRGTDGTSTLSTDPDSYFYMLSINKAKEPNSIGFYWGQEYGEAFINGAHKAYLKVSKENFNAYAKSFYLFSNTPTSIQSTIHSKPHANAPIHNIAGQRVNSNYKGIVICNGKKYILK